MNNNMIDDSMKVIKAYQHDPLGRQCAEAVWIRKVDQEKLINNKNEYIQPGDIETIYEKNDNKNRINNFDRKQRMKTKRVLN